MNWTQIRDTFSTQCSVESWVYIAHLVFEEGGHTIHNQWPSVANDAFDIWLCVCTCTVPLSVCLFGQVFVKMMQMQETIGLRRIWPASKWLLLEELANAHVHRHFLGTAAKRGGVLQESVWTNMLKWTWLPKSILSGKFVRLANLANSKISQATRNVLFAQMAMCHWTAPAVFLVLLALSHLETTLRHVHLVLKALSQTDRRILVRSARVQPTHLKEMSLAGGVSFQLWSWRATRICVPPSIRCSFCLHLFSWQSLSWRSSEGCVLNVSKGDSRN